MESDNRGRTVAACPIRACPTIYESTFDALGITLTSTSQSR